MAAIQGGGNEIVLLCVVDYLTGETLINRLVQPTQRVVDWQTRYSGVTVSMMAAAHKKGETLNGWNGARNALWQHIDAETVLIGHALQHDLSALRMIHPCVVDSAILTRNAAGPDCARTWALKTLCKDFLGIDIQNRGRKGHDGLEDALATRQVVLWCMRNPKELKEWGKVMAEEERRKWEQRKEEERLKKKQREEDERLKKEQGDEDEKRKEEGEEGQMEGAKKVQGKMKAGTHKPKTSRRRSRKKSVGERPSGIEKRRGSQTRHQGRHGTAVS